jgi:hypothetical protein
MQVVNRSIGELLTDLTLNLRTLVRQELALARAELTQNLTRTGRSAVLIGVGAAVAWAGALTMVAGICLALVALGLPPVAAAFSVGIALLLVGGLVMRSGKSGLTANAVVPRATVATIKDNAQFFRGQLR